MHIRAEACYTSLCTVYPLAGYGAIQGNHMVRSLSSPMPLMEPRQSWSTPGGCPRYADHAATWTYTRAGFLSAVPVARVWCRNCRRATTQMITDRRELDEVAAELGLEGVR